MTKDEIIVELEKLGIDFEITAEHDDGIHLVVKFDNDDDREPDYDAKTAQVVDDFLSDYEFEVNSELANKYKE